MSVVFKMQDRIPVGVNDFDYRGDAMKGRAWYRTQLSDTFFLVLKMSRYCKWD